MKKFLLKVAIFVIYALVLNIILPILIDPFNVFHAENLRDNGIEPNKNYIKMKYILANPKKFDGFVFGSSRAGGIHVEKIAGEKIYNMTYSVGVPSEHLDNLKTFIANDIRPSKIYIQIDNIAYVAAREEHLTQPLRCPYEYLNENLLHFCSLYMNFSLVAQSYNIILRHSPSLEFVNRFYQYGWEFKYNMESRIKNNKLYYQPTQIRLFRDKIKNTLSIINEIVNICRENKIELIIFTTPMYFSTHMKALDRNYLTFLEGLAQITDFYNFSGLNNITLENNNYIDTSHYKAEIGDIIINVICNGIKYPELNSQGGVKVTRDNVKDLIRLLEEQAADFKQKNVPGI